MKTFRLLLVNLFLVASLLAIFQSCKRDELIQIIKESEYSPTPYHITIPLYFPTILNIPEDNPMTVEGIELGRTLFYDGRFAGRSDPDSFMTCGTCHIQQYAFECGSSNPNAPGGFPHGVTGIQTPHVMLPLFNIVWNSNGYFWNGLIWEGNPNTTKRSLENVCWMGLYAPHEMFSDSNRSKALIGSIQGYKVLFKKAFGTEEVTFKRMSFAIAQFIRSIVSADSKFDKYLRGEVQLNASELHGFELFVTEQGADCFHCHGGDGNPLFTTNLFYNNGKKIIPDARDRYAVTGDPMDVGAYKATTLRNIELTGPYMHDGRFATLDEVINFYSDSLVWSPSVSPLMHKVADGGAKLLPQEKADLKAFLLTLTDYSLINNPDYGAPASLPE